MQFMLDMQLYRDWETVSSHDIMTGKLFPSHDIVTRNLFPSHDNGFEVPEPFEPKVGEEYWFIADYISSGYGCTQEGTGINSSIGKWKTEDEVKQVVAALRQVFGGV